MFQGIAGLGGECRPVWWAWLIIGLVALFIIGGWDYIVGGGDDGNDDGDGNDVGDGGGDTAADDVNDHLVALFIIGGWDRFVSNGSNKFNPDYDNHVNIISYAAKYKYMYI